MRQLLTLLKHLMSSECPLAALYRNALVQLMDDLSDAGDDRHPETGEEYSSCRRARLILEMTSRIGRGTHKHDATLIGRLDELENAVLAAIPYVRYCYNQVRFGEDDRELEALNLCRAAIGLDPISRKDEEHD